MGKGNPKGNPQNLTAPRFLPGQSGNPKGNAGSLRQALQADFIRELHKDFAAEGAQAIIEARKKDPLGYVRTVASLLPAQTELARPLDGLSDDELTAIADQLRSALSAAEDRARDPITGQLPAAH